MALVERVPMGRCRYCGEHCKRAVDDRRAYLEKSLAEWTRKAKTANYVDRAVAEQNAGEIRVQIADLPCAPRKCELRRKDEVAAPVPRPVATAAPQRPGLARRLFG